MRIKITFTSENPILLPIHYNYVLQSFIYNNLSDDFAEFLHSQGFKLGRRSFKLFTFSRIMGNFELLPEQKIQIFSPFEVVVSSPLEKFIKDFAASLLKKEDINLIGQRIEVENITVYPAIKEENVKDGIIIKMISPVVVYKTFRNETEKKTYYFNPVEQEFSELIKKNLIKKATILYNNNFEDSFFEIQPNFEVNQNYCKIIKYKDTVIKGWMGIYKICGDPLLLKTAYESGLGSKNSQGFGCFEILDEKKDVK